MAQLAELLILYGMLDRNFIRALFLKNKETDSEARRRFLDIFASVLIFYFCILEKRPVKPFIYHKIL